MNQVYGATRSDTSSTLDPCFIQSQCDLCLQKKPSAHAVPSRAGAYWIIAMRGMLSRRTMLKQGISTSSYRINRIISRYSLQQFRSSNQTRAALAANAKTAPANTLRRRSLHIQQHIT